MNEFNKSNVCEMTPRQENNDLTAFVGEWLTIPQIAAMLHPFYSASSIRSCVRRGTMPFEVKKIGGRWFALKSDVLTYIEHVSQKRQK